jgi:hypothetical protein
MILKYWQTHHQMMLAGAHEATLQRLTTNGPFAFWLHFCCSLVASGLQRSSENMTTLRQSPIIRETIDESGHYDAARLAKLLGWSLADLGRYLERDASTISRSGSAHVHQDRLATLAALIQEVFVLMNEDLAATIAWFRTPVRVLDWTSPRDLILRGDFPKVRNLVSEVHSGLSL